MFKYILVLSLIIPTPSLWAKCPEEVQVITKGEVANCDGLLFSPEASQKADEALDDSKYYKSLSEKLQLRIDYSIKETDLLDKRLRLYMDQSQLLAEEVYRKENQDKWQKAIYFSLGVLATGVAVYGASHLNN